MVANSTVVGEIIIFPHIACLAVIYQIWPEKLWFFASFKKIEDDLRKVLSGQTYAW